MAERLSGDKARLILLSFLMLFVELALIRWLGSNVVYLSYFSNFVLLGSFLGIGIGFVRQKSMINLFQLAPVLLALLIIMVLAFPIRIDHGGQELIYFGTDAATQHTLPLWLVLPVIFVMVTVIMAAIAEEVATSFRLFAPLEAYRLDIMGSLIGISFFMLLSFLGASPVWWGCVVCMTFAILFLTGSNSINKLGKIQLVALFLIIIPLAYESSIPNYIWSPYYKIQRISINPGDYLIKVNDISHQRIMSVAERIKRGGLEAFYFYPYEHRLKKAALDHVLVVGAGTGSDVAIALSKGAKHVDAVEIDPMLYSLGKKLNPDNPYRDPRVKIIINDGRAFLQKSQQLYDLIIFALPDSLTLVSGQSSLRLENYLFTLEAITSARQHLKSDGTFVMYNYYRERWLVDRLANMLYLVFKQKPCLDTLGKNSSWLSVMTVNKDEYSLQCNSRWNPLSKQYLSPSTDIHPFIYLKENKIPYFYISILIYIAITSLVLIKLMGGSYRAIKYNLDLFFMGAAFLLLETKSVINFALLFGTTWLVNALVFIGILLSIYLAIEVKSHLKFKRLNVLYFTLFAFLFLSWIIPEHLLLSLPYFLRFVSAVVLAFSPIFMANLIFACRYQNTVDSTAALGANLIGGMMGGLLEYSSLVIGYKDLLIVVAALYALSILIMNIHKVEVGD